ncbi:tripartite tricarboxylate transporter permease [Candidatus Micrarchaeota archaeon]|nr:tripartite tricarboxylate transporter permease [Candidatus Micrarchaeota archaeon]
MLLILCCLILGLFSGLIPGLHSNTVTSVLLSLNLTSESLPLAIVAMFGVHSIISFIPSIFLGIPDEQVVLSVLPGHRMAKEGRGIEAVMIMALSAIAALLVCIIFFPISQALYPVVYPLLSPYMPPILLIASAILVFKTQKPMHSFLIFLLAGIVGQQAFSLSLPDPFLPLFSGMFAMAAIFNFSSSPLPKQELPGKISAGLLRFSLLGVFLGWFADLLPGISSPAQVAAFASPLIPSSGAAYLALVSSIGVSESVFAFSTASTLGKARIGAIAEASAIVDVSQNLLPLLSFFIIGTAFACIALCAFRNRIGEIAKIHVPSLNLLIAAYLISIVFLIDSFSGLLLFAVSTALGFLCLRMNVERTLLMGAIIVPTILMLF